MTTPDPTVHAQFELTDPEGQKILVDEGIYLLLAYVWGRGLTTRSSCEGKGPTPMTELPYIVFPEVDDAVEFMRHTAVATDFRYGELVGMNILHPLVDLSGPPEGKVTWMPRITIPLINAWGKA